MLVGRPAGGPARIATVRPGAEGGSRPRVAACACPRAVRSPELPPGPQLGRRARPDPGQPEHPGRRDHEHRPDHRPRPADDQRDPAEQRDDPGGPQRCCGDPVRDRERLVRRQRPAGAHPAHRLGRGATGRPPPHLPRAAPASRNARRGPGGRGWAPVQRNAVSAASAPRSRERRRAADARRRSRCPSGRAGGAYAVRSPRSVAPARSAPQPGRPPRRPAHAPAWAARGRGEPGAGVQHRR